jgi:hypothetical protein
MKNIKMYEDFDTSYDGWETTYSSKFEGHDRDEQNYMFFQHLMTIKDAIDDLMQMDREKVDMILTNGHAWAIDHITTSADDIEEVYHFMKNTMAEMEDGSHGDNPMQVSPMNIEILGSNDDVEIEDEDGDDEDE